MLPPSGRLEIRAEHLGRQAVIYVRQSTPVQVRETRPAPPASMTSPRGPATWAGPLPSSSSTRTRPFGGHGRRSRRLPRADRPGRPGSGRGRLQPGGLAPGALLQRLVQAAGALCPDRDADHRRGGGLRSHPVQRPAPVGLQGDDERGRAALAPLPVVGGPAGAGPEGAVPDAAAHRLVYDPLGRLVLDPDEQVQQGSGSCSTCSSSPAPPGRWCGTSTPTTSSSPAGSGPAREGPGRLGGSQVCPRRLGPASSGLCGRVRLRADQDHGPAADRRCA